MKVKIQGNKNQNYLKRVEILAFYLKICLIAKFQPFMRKK